MVEAGNKTPLEDHDQFDGVRCECGLNNGRCLQDGGQLPAHDAHAGYDGAPVAARVVTVDRVLKKNENK